MTPRIAYSSKASPAHIETDRLSLRPFQWKDLPTLHQLWNDAPVRKYLWDDVLISRKTAASVVQRSIADFRNHGFGQWVVFLRDHKELIGFCGFRFMENATEIEILYGFLPSVWKQGHATEAAAAVLKYGFEQCGFDQVFGRTDVPNVASVKLLERLGMSFVGRERVNNLDTLKYTMTRQGSGATKDERP
ncbi:MAG TPA: GNAT family N-acetyltransferase [Acidobacteriota bacterium]|nr:GNAT family N-acetyltransferase [Acidobacteriota bacterium]